MRELAVPGIGQHIALSVRCAKSLPSMQLSLRLGGFDRFLSALEPSTAGEINFIHTRPLPRASVAIFQVEFNCLFSLGRKAQVGKSEP
jgi:hypothetical protein